MQERTRLNKNITTNLDENKKTDLYKIKPIRVAQCSAEELKLHLQELNSCICLLSGITNFTDHKWSLSQHIEHAEFSVLQSILAALIFDRDIFNPKKLCLGMLWFVLSNAYFISTNVEINKSVSEKIPLSCLSAVNYKKIETMSQSLGIFTHPGDDLSERLNYFNYIRREFAQALTDKKAWEKFSLYGRQRLNKNVTDKIEDFLFLSKYH